MKSPKFRVFVCINFVLTCSVRVQSIDSSLATTAALSKKQTVHSSFKLKEVPFFELDINNELCEYYGYRSEIHKVTTDDGYILTLFRCNSKTAESNGEVVILQHGFFATSDDWVMNSSNQSLAFIMADRGYDVWLPNFRGNFYSRHHESKSKSPDNFLSGFWDLSFDTIAYHDNPAIYDYIRRVTLVLKLYIIAHSQGTSSLMALLSMKPEFNNYFKAISLLAPVGYIGNAATLYQVLGGLESPLQILRNQEFLARVLPNVLLGTVCNDALTPVCGGLLQLIYGRSDNLNSTMIGTYLRHAPSGSSTTQGLHFLDEIKYDYFGPQKTGLSVPPNFPLHEITVPVSLHHSSNDPFTNSDDVKRLINELIGPTDLLNQPIETGNFCHVDFVWGMNTAELVYSKVIEFFQKHK